ncbi:hypothetical protein [Marmoricola sp. Leaf446]|uniref:hypothetical protein n=1 Tax=Marmoricola sp. Leaf446 TaxID=1736379 RepID=UPI0012E3E8BA|nr:hypothetical protein [Marmoricola sp. Leaf446]
MSGQFDVVTAELTAAADRIRSAVAPVACYTLPSTGASATAVGHDQLGEVVTAFCEKVGQVVSATALGDEAAAGELDASAAAYDATDAANQAVYTAMNPFGLPVASPR